MTKDSDNIESEAFINRLLTQEESKLIIPELIAENQKVLNEHNENQTS